MPTVDGSIGKVWALHLIYLRSSLIASNPSLVGIHKGWLAGLNLSALHRNMCSLANPHFSSTHLYYIKKRKKKKEKKRNWIELSRKHVGHVKNKKQHTKD